MGNIGVCRRGRRPSREKRRGKFQRQTTAEVTANRAVEVADKIGFRLRKGCSNYGKTPALHPPPWGARCHFIGGPNFFH